MMLPSAQGVKVEGLLTRLLTNVAGQPDIGADSQPTRTSERADPPAQASARMTFWW
jgi:hypothetical protein